MVGESGMAGLQSDEALLPPIHPPQPDRSLHLHQMEGWKTLPLPHLIVPSVSWLSQWRFEHDLLSPITTASEHLFYIIILLQLEEGTYDPHHRLCRFFSLPLCMHTNKRQKRNRTRKGGAMQSCNATSCPLSALPLSTSVLSPFTPECGPQ